MSEIEQNEGEARSYHRWQFRLGALGILNGWSRRVDDFALRLSQDPAAFIGAMERLAGLNLAERNPHFLKELPLYSHPWVGRRIDRARNRSWSEG
jgi:Zn-dependent protease with chaperone function